MSRRYKQENPKSIYIWGEETFGKRSTQSVAARTALEVCELVIAFVNHHPLDKQLDELADVAVMTWQLAVAHSIDARPIPSINFIGALNDTPLSYAVALSRAFGTYMERLVCAGNDPGDHLKKTLMALEEIANLMGVDLPSLVDEKMAINRARLWAKLADGNYQHSAVA